MRKALLLSFAVVVSASAEAQTQVRHIVTAAVVQLRACPQDPCKCSPDGCFSLVVGQTDSGVMVGKSEGDLWIRRGLTKFDADRSYARAYYGNRATNCASSTSERVGDEYRGRFVLSWLPERTQVIRIATPGATASYVRAWLGNDCRQGSIDTSEEWRHEQWNVEGVLFGKETIRLQFGRKKADVLAPGLWIQDPFVLPDARSGDARELDSEKVLQALAAQRLVSPRLSANPNASSNARESDRLMLIEAGVKTLQLKVE